MTTRRLFLAGSAAFALSACSSTGRSNLNSNVIQVDEPWASHYSLRNDNGYTIPGIDIRRIPQQYWRQEVEYYGSEAPGSIVVNTTDRFLYLVQPGGWAIRYGVGVGREEGLNFRGNATVGRKAAWPHWTPTANMIRTQPDKYGPFASGLEGGLKNPLGARALYLYRGGKDTHFRLHGTIEPYSIGESVSSGCIRLINQDIIDLYGRVQTGARVTVIS